MNSKLRRRASACPMVVLPEPETPMTTSTVIACLVGCGRWTRRSTCSGRCAWSWDLALAVQMVSGRYLIPRDTGALAAGFRPAAAMWTSELPTHAEGGFHRIERVVEAIHHFVEVAIARLGPQNQVIRGLVL